MRKSLLVLSVICLLFASPLLAQVKLQQSTAYTVTIGPFLDSSDGITTKTGLTIAQADVRLSKNGAAWAQKSDATSCTHQENGWYQCPLNTTDTATTGILSVSIQKSGAVPVWTSYMILTSTAYAAEVTTGPASLTTITSGVADIQARIPAALTANGNIKADTLRVSGTTQTAGDVGAGVAAIKVTTDRVAGAQELDSGLYRFTTAALALAPSGTGASAASIRAEIDSNSTQLAALVASVAAGRIVKKSTAKMWPMQFRDTLGNLVTSGTPACLRSIDSVSSFVTAASGGTGGVAASAVNSRGLSMITLSTADTNGADYVILECSLSGATLYQNVFVIQQP